MRKAKLLVCGAALAALVTACSQSTSGSPSGTDGGQGGGGASVVTPAKDLPTLVSNISEASKAKESAKFTLSLSGSQGGAAQNLSGKGELRFGDSPASHMMLTAGPQGSLEFTFVDKAIYLKSPQFSKLAGGKQWVKISADGNDPLSKLLGASLTQANQVDPSQTLGLYKDAATIDSSEPAQLDGKPTTHYKLTVDLQKLAEKQTDPQLKQLYQLSTKSGLKTFPIEMWVGADNLPAQIKVATPAPTGGSAEGLTSTVVKYSDWGAQVDISAPPASEVGQLKLPSGAGGAPAPVPGG